METDDFLKFNVLILINKKIILLVCIFSLATKGITSQLPVQLSKKNGAWNFIFPTKYTYKKLCFAWLADHVVSKESPKTINGRREDMGSTVEWGGGNIIAPNKRGGQPAESSHVEQKDFMSSNGTSGTKAPNQIGGNWIASSISYVSNSLLSFFLNPFSHIVDKI